MVSPVNSKCFIKNKYKKGTNIFGNGNLRRRVLLIARVAVEVIAASLGAASAVTAEVTAAEVAASKAAARGPVEVGARPGPAEVVETASGAGGSVPAHGRAARRGAAASRAHGWHPAGGSARWAPRSATGPAAAAAATATSRPAVTLTITEAAVLVRIEIIIVMWVVILNRTFDRYLKLLQSKIDLQSFKIQWFVFKWREDI